MSDPVVDGEELSWQLVIDINGLILCPLQRSDCLTVDPEKPKPKFVKEVLEKSMRYSLAVSPRSSVFFS